MNDPLSRVLLRWGDSNLYWWPFARLRPDKTTPLPATFAVSHALSGLLWAGLPFLLLVGMWLQRPSPEAFLIPGAIGAIASGTFALLVRSAWNRRATLHRHCLARGEKIPTPIPADPTPFERGLVEPVLVLAVLGLALTLVYAVENLRGALALRSFVAELRANHAPVTVADITPPPIPEDRNLAFAPLLRPLTDYTRTDATRPNTGSSIVWRDTNGFQRASHMFDIEDRGQSMARFLSARSRARRAEAATNAPTEPPAPEHNPADSRTSWQEGHPVDLPLWQAYYRSLTNWPHTDAPQTPARDVLLALTRSDPDLQELRAAAAARPECRFPLAYEDGFEMLLAPLAPLKAAANFLRLRACALLAEDRPDDALADTLLALRLSDAIADEPVLISVLVRIVMDQRALQPIWEGCRDHRWSDAHLAALQAALASRNHPAALRRALDGERILTNVFYDALARGDTRALNSVGGDTGDGREDTIAILIRLMPRGWIRHNQVAHGRYIRTLVQDLASAPNHAAIVPGDSRLQHILDRKSLFTFLAGMLAPALERASEKVYAAEASHRLALVGLALERHRLAEGAYPEHLDALVPRFLASLPEDPMDGQPLRYARTADGDFHLYSVGPDHHDIPWR